MEIFINSTFAQSVSGYRLLRMGEADFEPIGSAEQLPQAVYQFFIENKFRMIWYEIPAGKKQLVPTGSFLGIKQLTGVFDNGKKGVVDIVFWSDAGEIFMLAYLANKILSHFSCFSELVFRSFHIESDGSYHVKKEQFLESLEQINVGDYPAFVANTAFFYRTAKDFLHLAVYTCSRETVFKAFPGKWSVKQNYPCVMEEKEFESYLNK